MLGFLSAMSQPKHVVITTDGSCLGNPGPGGYGAVLKYMDHRNELSGGFRLTTSSRMELMAAIVGLETLRERCHVTLRSDSQYLVRALQEGWAQRWRANDWMRNDKEKALNPDLWDQLLNLCEKHEMGYEWVEGHSGDPENERCDQLAKRGASQANLPVDEEYEARGRALEGRGSPTATLAGDVRSGLRSSDTSRRKAAIFRAVEEQYTELGPDLVELMERERDQNLKGRCAWALGRMNYREAYPNLVNGLKHRSQEYRTWSAWALGELGDSRAEMPLRLAEEEEKSGKVRQSIGGALKKLNFDSTRVHRHQLEKALQPPATSDPALMLIVKRLEQLEWPSDSEQIIDARADMKRHDCYYFDSYMEWVQRKPGIIAALEDRSKVFG